MTSKLRKIIHNSFYTVVVCGLIIGWFAVIYNYFVNGCDNTFPKLLVFAIIEIIMIGSLYFETENYKAFVKYSRKK